MVDILKLVECISKLPGIALLVSSARIELVSSLTRDTSVKSTKVTQLETLGPIDRTPGIPGSDKNHPVCDIIHIQYSYFVT